MRIILAMVLFTCLAPGGSSGNGGRTMQHTTKENLSLKKSSCSCGFNLIGQRIRTNWLGELAHRHAKRQLINKQR